MSFWIWIAVRIVANPLSNVFQKLLASDRATPLFVIGLTHGLLAIPCAGFCCLWPLPVEPAFWLNMTVCAVLALAGNVCIVQALKTSDLSILGPVNAYKSIVSLVPGALLLHEIPGPMALAGIALIVTGSYLIVDRPRGANRNAFVLFFSDRGVQYRLAALVLSATEAVFLKRALLAGSPLVTFCVWGIAGFLLFALIVPVTSGKMGISRERKVFLDRWLAYLCLAVTTGLMQFATLVVLNGFPVAAALALFQISILLSVVLGWQVFREQNFLQRLLGSLVMVGGAVLIIFSRP